MVGKKRQQAAVLAEDEEFPRGGAELLTAQERRQIEKEALAAVEGEIAAGKSPARKKTKVGKLGGGAKEVSTGGRHGPPRHGCLLL